jgi:GT2 family glycosyltransferase
MYEINAMGISTTVKKEIDSSRYTVKGKFIFKNNIKLYLKGVTYGTFKPLENGFQFPNDEIIKKDLLMISENGFNCIRTYTVPSKFLLDTAHELNINVMVGLPWAQHITFLDNAKSRENIINNVKAAVERCEAHPAILCYTIGNEIPASIVRWYGKEKIEKFLKQLYKVVKKVDPDSLVTYVNYPTTEYLELDFLDFDCFNVYLESPEKLSKYISRLHSLVSNRPLVLAEIGLDSLRNGEQKQGEVLTWQLETIFSKGCSGIFVFAWTDEWWRGGTEILDWNFGLVDRQRNPKPALTSMRSALDKIPFESKSKLPHITIIVCTYNGSATIKKCLESILKINYPHYDVVVVNDGSTDNTEEIIKTFPVKLITTSNHGLSNARNRGMYNAIGEIIAYIDDDAFADPDWLKYLAYEFNNSTHSCIGGPNISPTDSEFISTCVANAPGGPVHVMLSDEIAEHVPGCNMSFRKIDLQNIGGFDPTFRSAGDDVDVCWRIQEAGGTIGFHPSALVWHLRRNSIKAYWKQQKGYGKAEALLEAKWPEKYNSFGHITWAGRIYGNGFTSPIKFQKDKIFHGVWGTSLFQSVYEPAGSFIASIPLMPEWYVLTASFGLLGLLGFLWQPMFLLIPLFILAVFIVFIQAVISSKKNSSLQPHEKKKIKYRLLIIFLHMIQPIARLYGRFTNGLTPIRKRGVKLNLRNAFQIKSCVHSHWSEEWKSSEDWLTLIEKNLYLLKTRTRRGYEFDAWDLQVSNGLFSRSRSILTIEEHGMGKQYLKLKCWPVFSISGFIIPILFLSLSIAALFSGQWIVFFITGLIGASIGINLFLSTARAMNNMKLAFMNLSKILETEKTLNLVLKEKNGEIIDEQDFIPETISSKLNIHIE